MKYRYTGSFEKIFYSGKEVAEKLKIKYKELLKIVRKMNYRKVGNILEIPINDLGKIKKMLEVKK